MNRQEAKIGAIVLLPHLLFVPLMMNGTVLDYGRTTEGENLQNLSPDL